jgi:hypothetical protein
MSRARWTRKRVDLLSALKPAATWMSMLANDGPPGLIVASSHAIEPSIAECSAVMNFEGAKKNDVASSDGASFRAAPPGLPPQPRS